ncbi:MAG: TRAP transporter substrate-binding protein [Chloroflexota bacterium]
MANSLGSKQNRRTFLKSVAALGSLAAIPLLSACSTAAPAPAATTAPAPAATQAPARPAKVVTIRTGHTAAAEHPYTEILTRWGNSLAQKTNGAFQVEVHPGGVLGSGRTAPEGVALGTFEASMSDPAEYASFNQALNILSGPFIWDSPAHIAKTVYLPEVYNTLFDPVLKKGLRVLSVGYSGTRHLTTKNTAVKKPEDTKGLKIRVPEVPVYKDMVAAWGASPTPIPMAEVFPALQSGTVDGQENPYAQIISNKFYEVQKYLNLTGHITQTNSIIFNEQLYQQQSPEFQKALVDTAKAAQQDYADLLQNDNQKMLDQLKGFGMTVVEPDREAFRAAMAKVYEQYDQTWTKALREKIAASK